MPHDNFSNCNGKSIAYLPNHI
uniref:Uncharacterized protein n=1 Tax=Anguilla anguilla TaxID=7936 RepID=A0A0E9T1R8_ANGAN